MKLSGIRVWTRNLLLKSVFLSVTLETVTLVAEKVQLKLYTLDV